MGHGVTSIFDYVDADNWLRDYEIEGAALVGLVLTEASEVRLDESLDADLGTKALIAAEVVASAYKRPSQMDAPTRALVKRHAPDVRAIPGLPACALWALERVTGANSKLAEQWDKANEVGADAFRSVVESLRLRLETIA